MMVALCSGLQLWVMACMFINIDSASITCAAGTYVVGQPASITCNFRTNISATQRSFYMEHRPSLTETTKTGTFVLECSWSGENQEHDCSVTHGYTFDNVITDQVTVEISKTEEAFEGPYRCFFVPSDGEEIHACDFNIELESEKAVDGTQTTPPPNEDGIPKTEVIVAVSLVLVALVGCVLVCIFCRHRRNKKRECVVAEETVAFITPQDNEITQRLNPFKLTTQTLKAMMDLLDQEMKKGLNETTRAQATVKMYPVCCPLPDKLGLGDYLMVDFGSTCVQVSDINLRKHGVNIPSASYPLDPAMKNATGEQLFDFIVSAISRFVKDQDKSDKQLKSVLVVHFPCHHKNIDKANIAKWTKEFSCEGIVDQDLNELLQKSIRKKTALKLKVVAIVNSVVNTLISAVCHNPRCMISLVVGNGFNACYVDKSQKEETDGAEGKGSLEIYNTELGALGENGSLDFLRTAYDTELDNTSTTPGSQILEKMASWTYIGEIVRLALKDLRKDQLVLPDAPEFAGIFIRGVFTANHVAKIDKDMSENSGETAKILRNVGVLNPTEEDLKTVKYICGLVTERAASLAAASLATLINRLDQPEIVIVVDGEIYRHSPRFHGVMYSKTQEFVKPALRDKFYLVSSLHGGRTGAVRMAAAALSKKNATAADT